MPILNQSFYLDKIKNEERKFGKIVINLHHIAPDFVVDLTIL